jgi:transposase
VSETARRLGIGAKLLGRWKRDAEASSSGAFSGNGHVSPEPDELIRLRKENQRLLMERDILKKSLIFFANESS